MATLPPNLAELHALIKQIDRHLAAGHGGMMWLDCLAALLRKLDQYHPDGPRRA